MDSATREEWKAPSYESISSISWIASVSSSGPRDASSFETLIDRVATVMREEVGGETVGLVVASTPIGERFPEAR